MARYRNIVGPSDYGNIVGPSDYGYRPRMTSRFTRRSGMFGLGIVDGQAFVSHEAMKAALGWDPAPHSLPAGSVIYIEPADGAGAGRVHWRKPDGQTGVWDMAFGTDAEERAAYAAQDLMLGGSLPSSALIDQPWVPYAGGAVALAALVGVWLWAKNR